LRIEEVEDLLNTLRLLGMLAPEHIFITDEPIYEELDGKVYFRGLAPKNKRGVMVLSAQANVTTVPHEWVHSALGLGELAAYPIGNLLALRYKLTKKLVEKFPLLKSLRLREVKYQEADVPKKFSGRIKHYVRVK